MYESGKYTNYGVYMIYFAEKCSSLKSVKYDIWIMYGLSLLFMLLCL